jgi:integrase
MGKRIVEKSIKKMDAPEKGNRIEWDSEIHGFGVRITATGVKSFILDYRISGRHRRFTIGQYPEWTASAARDEALILKKKIRGNKDEGIDPIDPLEEKRKDRSEPTLGDLATEYMQSVVESKKQPSTRRNDLQMLNSIIVPRLGKLRLKAIGRQDIEKLHSSLKATPYQANRVLELLSTMFNYAIKEKIGADNPARGVEAFPEAKRECWLTVEDLQRFREALDSYADQNAANALRLLMLTGSREGEVLKAEWEEFDLARGVWTKPSHHTKQKKLEHIPLSAPALKLLESMMPVNPIGPLFPGATGGARTTLRRPWVQACKKAGLVEKIAVKGKRHTITKFRPTIRIHDLRHNFASHLASNGVTLQIVGKLLGHTMAQTTMRYAHLQDEALRAATNRFGDIYSEAKKA